MEDSSNVFIQIITGGVDYFDEIDLEELKKILSYLQEYRNKLAPTIFSNK